MDRVPLIDENATADIAALARKIRGARRGQLHVFYRALLHSPDIAAAWFEFNNVVRFRATFDDRMRELLAFATTHGVVPSISSPLLQCFRILADSVR